MTNVHARYLLAVLIVMSTACANVSLAHCRLTDEQRAALSVSDRQKLDTFDQRINASATTVNQQLSPATQPARIRLPPPPPPQEPPPTGATQPLQSSIDCEALLKWITDVYNSAFCHLKHSTDEESKSDHVECLANYPGNPAALRASIKAYSITTDSEPAKAFRDELLVELTDLAGKTAVCEGTATPDEFNRSVDAFFKAKLQLDKKLDEYDQESLHRRSVDMR